jgi:hypothetical protein
MRRFGARNADSDANLLTGAPRKQTWRGTATGLTEPVSKQ